MDIETLGLIIGGILLGVREAFGFWRSRGFNTRLTTAETSYLSRLESAEQTVIKQGQRIADLETLTNTQNDTIKLLQKEREERDQKIEKGNEREKINTLKIEELQTLVVKLQSKLDLVLEDKVDLEKTLTDLRLELLVTRNQCALESQRAEIEKKRADDLRLAFDTLGNIREMAGGEKKQDATPQTNPT